MRDKVLMVGMAGVVLAFAACACLGAVELVRYLHGCIEVGC